MKPLILASTFALAACATPVCPPAPVRVETVTQTKLVAKPCAAAIPERPAKLPDALPSDAVQLAAILAAKLSEWSAPGQFGDAAISALKRCQQP